jgi:hypothetical protein
MSVAPAQSDLTPGHGAEGLQPRDVQPPEPAPIPVVLLSYDQMLVQIAERRTVSQQDAEEIVNSPGMASKIARAMKELDRVWRAELGRAKAKYKKYELAVVEERRILPALLSDDDDVFRILGLEGRTYSTTWWIRLWRKRSLPAEDVGPNDVTWDHIAGVLEGFKRKWPVGAADVTAATERAESPTTSPTESGKTILPPEESPPPDEQPRPPDQLEDDPNRTAAAIHEDAHQEVISENGPSTDQPSTKLPPGYEQLTYAQMGKGLGCSKEAARKRADRLKLPRALGSDGKIRVTVNLQDVHQRRTSTRSLGGDRPVVKPETTSPSPAGTTGAGENAGTAVVNDEAEGQADGYQAKRVRRSLKRLYPDGVPGGDDVTTSALQKQVAEDLKSETRRLGLRNPSWQVVAKVRDNC